MSDDRPEEGFEPLPGAESSGPPDEPYDLPLGGESPVTPGEPAPPAGSAPAGSSWPDVMGIIAIIVGAIGILSKLGTVFYPFFRPWAIEFASRHAPPGTIESFFGFLPDTAVVMLSGLVEMGLAILLLIGGIHLRNRRQLGARVLKIWAWISIPWAVLETGLATVMVRGIMPRLPHVRSLDFPIDGFVQFGIAFGLLFALAVPIFLLAWFGSRSISAEVSGWPE